MGQRIIRIDYDLIAHILQLPHDVKVVGVSTEMGFDRNKFLLKVESPEFAETKEGCQLPEIVANYSVFEANGIRGVLFAGWSPNFPLNPPEYTLPADDAVFGHGRLADANG